MLIARDGDAFDFELQRQGDGIRITSLILAAIEAAHRRTRR